MEEENEVGLPQIDYSALSKSVYDYDQTQAQYGGEKQSSRGSQFSKQAYNSAWEEYSKANPDADKKGFRNIYTTKAKDEEELTPWQIRAREDVEHAATLAKEDSDSFRKKQSEGFGGLDVQEKANRGRKALEGIKKMTGGGALPDDISKLVKYYGSQSGNSRNLKDEDFGKIQKYLESRSGTGYAENSNQLLQGLYKQKESPMQRSPFKALDLDVISKSFNASADVNAGARAGIAEFEAAKRQEEEDARREQQAGMQRLQYADMMAKQQEGLIVSGDTGVNQADIAVNSASRALVDQAGALTSQLTNGDITSDEWANQTAQIRAQVPALKQFKETLNTNMSTYQDALMSGDLSAAMDPSTVDLYGSLLNGTGAVQLGIDPETQQVTFGGTTANGEQIKIPAGGMSRMPKPILKAADPYESLKEPFGQLAQAHSTMDPEDLRAKSDEILEGLLPQDPDQQNKMLLSLAVDRFGMKLSEAKELLQSPADDGNPLANHVRTKFAEVASTAFESQVIKRRKDEQALANAKIQEQKLSQSIDHAAQQNYRQDQTFQQNTDIRNRQMQDQDAAKQQNADYTASIQNRIVDLDPNEPGKMANELAALGAPVVWDNKKGFVVIKNGKAIMQLGKDPAVAKRWAAKQLGQDLNKPAQQSPVQRQSPFQRLNTWFSKLGGKKKDEDSPLNAALPIDGPKTFAGAKKAFAIENGQEAADSTFGGSWNEFKTRNPRGADSNDFKVNDYQHWAASEPGSFSPDQIAKGANEDSLKSYEKSRVLDKDELRKMGAFTASQTVRRNKKIQEKEKYKDAIPGAYSDRSVDMYKGEKKRGIEYGSVENQYKRTKASAEKKTKDFMDSLKNRKYSGGSPMSNEELNAIQNQTHAIFEDFNQQQRDMVQEDILAQLQEQNQRAWLNDN